MQRVTPKRVTLSFAANLHIGDYCRPSVSSETNNEYVRTIKGLRRNWTISDLSGAFQSTFKTSR